MRREEVSRMVAIIRPLPEWRLNCGWRLKLGLWVERETVPRRLEETEDERTPDPRLVAAPPPADSRHLFKLVDGCSSVREKCCI